MNSSKCRNAWNALRVYVLASIVIAMVFAIVYSQAHTFDCEGPSGEAIQAEKNYDNQQNRDAYERVIEDRDRPGDTEKSIQYLRDNMV